MTKGELIGRIEKAVDSLDFAIAQEGRTFDFLTISANGERTHQGTREEMLEHVMEATCNELSSLIDDLNELEARRDNRRANK